MEDYLILIPVAYVLGSIPFGVYIGRIFGGIDVREYGSGNIGMTNVLRAVGLPAAIIVLVLDMSKAIIVVIIARILSNSYTLEALSAVTVLVGHSWSVFSGFRGGKSTASGYGVLFALAPIAGIVASIVGFSLIIFTRYVSLGSIAAAILGCGTLIVLSVTGNVPFEYIWFGLIGGPIVVIRHKDNISRLLNGEERKIGQKI